IAVDRTTEGMLRIVKSRVLAALAAIVLGTVALGAQASARLPRLQDGHPDFNGVWDYRSQIPLERRGEKTESGSAAPQEAADAQGKTVPVGVGPQLMKLASRDPQFQDPPAPADSRSSLIIDPPDGHLPPLQPGIQPQLGSFEGDLPTSGHVRYRG